MIAARSNRFLDCCMNAKTLAYEIVRSKRRKTAAIKVEPGQVRVLVPYWVDERWVANWVNEKRAWVERQQETLAQHSDAFEIAIYPGAMLPLLDRTLILSWDFGARNGVLLEGDCLRVTLNRRGSRSDVERVTELVKSWYQEQATCYLQERLVHWQQITGLSPTGLTVKSFRRRWGSCDSRGRISLNWRLIMAPSKQVDYVIVHELAHLKHFDHSKRFWALVATFVADYSALRHGLQCRYPLLYF